jgi:hypothetical protein
MKRSILAIATLAALAASCRRCGSAGPPATCTPPSTTKAESLPADVRSVTLYWDTSQSMAAYLQADSALSSLWRSLDSKWTRRASQTIDSVDHVGVGATIRPLARLGGAPAATDGWTNLPHMGERIGQLLEARDDAAAVVVSDMLVDTPPLPAGTKLCGDVLVPTGRGDVPSLVGKCLSAGLGGAAPADLVVTAVALLDPIGPRTAARPLFVTIFARNARFASQLASVLSAELAAYAPASLSILKAAALVPCERVSSCRYHSHAALVSHDDCNFTVTRESQREQIPMTCFIDPPDPSFEAGLLALQPQSMTRNGGDLPATERLGKRVVDLRIPLVPAGHELSARTRWGMRDDAGARIDQWLAGRYDNVGDYRDLYRTMAAVLARQLPAPICRATATIQFVGR